MARDYRAELAEADRLLEDARRAAEAARVPDDDIDTGYRDEPVTVSGWYTLRTLSGRAAWRYCLWSNGRVHEYAPTYDRQAHDELQKASLAHYDALQALRDHPEEYR